MLRSSSDISSFVVFFPKATIYFLMITLLVGCGLPIRNLSPQDAIPSSKAKQEVFSVDQTELVFDCAIESGKSYNSGILVIARDSMKEDHFRAVFLAKAGMKILDMEISPDDLIVHQVIDALDRKLVLKMLADDFRLMMKDDWGASKGFFEMEDLDGYVERKKKARCFYHLYRDQDGAITRVDKGGKKRAAVVMNVERALTGEMTNLSIDHQRIPLKLSLKPLDR